MLLISSLENKEMYDTYMNIVVISFQHFWKHSCNNYKNSHLGLKIIHIRAVLKY